MWSLQTTSRRAHGRILSRNIEQPSPCPLISFTRGIRGKKNSILLPPTTPKASSSSKLGDSRPLSRHARHDASTICPATRMTSPMPYTAACYYSQLEPVIAIHTDRKESPSRTFPLRPVSFAHEGGCGSMSSRAYLPSGAGLIRVLDSRGCHDGGCRIDDWRRPWIYLA